MLLLCLRLLYFPLELLLLAQGWRDHHRRRHCWAGQQSLLHQQLRLQRQGEHLVVGVLLLMMMRGVQLRTVWVGRLWLLVVGVLVSVMLVLLLLLQLCLDLERWRWCRVSAWGWCWQGSLGGAGQPPPKQAPVCVCVCVIVCVCV